MASLRKYALAWLMAKGTARYERMIAERKRALFSGDLGDVVEIGAGTGPNLRYLHEVRSYRAIEPNRYMHPYLSQEMQRQCIAGHLDAEPAESAFACMAPSSVDTVIATLVLCSVRNPRALVEDLCRILRPGGRFLFLEHVGAVPGTPLRLCQQCLVPLFHFCGDGCRPTSDTATLLNDSPFEELHIDSFELPLGPIAPHICGWGRR